MRCGGIGQNIGEVRSIHQAPVERRNARPDVMEPGQTDRLRRRRTGQAASLSIWRTGKADGMARCLRRGRRGSARARSCAGWSRMMGEYILTLSCRDRPGLVADVAGRIASSGGNILEAAQFDDVDTGQFFMRLRFRLEAAGECALRQRFADQANGHEMKWALRS